MCDEEEGGNEGVTPNEPPSQGHDNAETLLANLALYRLVKGKKKSLWIQIFNPKSAYYATRVNLINELMQPLIIISLELEADSPMLLLQAMV